MYIWSKPQSPGSKWISRRTPAAAVAAAAAAVVVMAAAAAVAVVAAAAVWGYHIRYDILYIDACTTQRH